MVYVPLSQGKRTGYVPLSQLRQTPASPTIPKGFDLAASTNFKGGGQSKLRDAPKPKGNILASAIQAGARFSQSKPVERLKSSPLEALVEGGTAAREFVFPKRKEVFERKQKEAGMSLLPTKEVLEDTAYETSFAGANVKLAGNVATEGELENFFSEVSVEPEFGGFSASVKRAGSKLLKKLVKATDEDTALDLVRQLDLNLTPQTEQVLARNVAVENDAGRIDTLIGNAVRQSQEEVMKTGQRRYTLDNLPKVADDEIIVGFERTGGDRQWVETNLEKLGRFGDNYDIGVVKKSQLQKTGDAIKDADGIAIIPRNLADDIVKKNRFLPPVPKVPKKVSQAQRPPRQPLDQMVNQLDELRTQLEILDDRLEADPIKQLLRYVSKKTGELPEITGKRKGTEFARRGDQLLDQAGFGSIEEANQALRAFRQDTTERAFIRREERRLAGEVAERRKARRITTTELADRRRQFRALTDRFNLTPSEINAIRNRYGRGDIGSLTENQFARFMEAAEKAGSQVSNESQLRGIIKANIEQRNLQNTDALREYMKFPSLKDMNMEQLREFDTILSQYKDNDYFLTKRQLEVFHRTRLAGARTEREVKTALAKELDVPLESLNNVKYGQMDRFLYDSALRNQSPVHRLIVDRMTESLLQGNVAFAKFEDRIDDLLVAARKSRPSSVGQKIAPTDENIFRYLEADDAAKATMRGDMTPEELAAADFLKDRYLEAYEYLIREDAMKKGIKDYVTHIRRSGLEAFREEGFRGALKAVFEQYKVEQETFQIVNNKTGDVLPFEKFFAFAQRRTGGLTPSKNVGRSSKAYFMAFERKRALDSIVPELDAYVKVLTPKKQTKTGLDMDPRLQNLFKQYLNTKRGRPVTAFVDPGSKPDVVIRGLLALTRVIDLGFSIPNFIAANVGEQAATFIQAGPKVMAKGTARMNTKQGKKIVEKYRGVFGRTPWQALSDTSQNAPDKAFTLLLAGFQDASVRANKQGILGMLTEQEFKSGTISPERLAQIRLDIGTWRALDNTSSIYGSTSLGKVATQYKAWAVPIIYSTQQNLRKAIQMTANGQNPMQSIEGQQLMREILLLGTVGLFTYNYFSEEPDSYMDEITHKSARDALSAIGALNPEMWLQTPRIQQYLQDIWEAVDMTIRGEEYKTGDKEGQLKGPVQFGRLITPAPVRQMQRGVGSEESSTSGGLPTLPSLPSGSLPELPKLPKLPSL